MGSHQHGSLKLGVSVSMLPELSSGCSAPRYKPKQERKILRQERRDNANAEVPCTSLKVSVIEQPEKQVLSWHAVLGIRKRKRKRKMLMLIRKQGRNSKAKVLGKSPKWNIDVHPEKKLGSACKLFEIRNHEHEMRRQDIEISRKVIEVDKGRSATLDKLPRRNLDKLQEKEKKDDHDDDDDDEKEEVEQVEAVKKVEESENTEEVEEVEESENTEEVEEVEESESREEAEESEEEQQENSEEDGREKEGKETGKEEPFPWDTDPFQSNDLRDYSLLVGGYQFWDELARSGQVKARHIAEGILRQLGSSSISTKSSADESRRKRKMVPEVNSTREANTNPVLELTKVAPFDSGNDSGGQKRKSPTKQSAKEKIHRKPGKSKSSNGKAEDGTSELSVIVIADSDDDSAEIKTSIKPSSRQSDAKKAEAACRVARANEFVCKVGDRLERFDSLDEPEIKDVLSWAFFGGTNDDVVAYIPGCNISIKRRSMCRLSQSQWLDCDILGAYAHLINERNISRRKDVSEVSQCDDESVSSVRSEEKRPVARVHCFDTFFYTLLTGDHGAYDYERVRKYTEPKRWRSGARSGVSVVDTDLIMVPVNIGQSHWVLCIIDMMRGVFYFADSQAGSRSKKALKILENVRRWLQDELLVKHGVIALNGRKIHDFQVVPDLRVPKQGDGGSCGVFAIMYAEAIEWYGRVRFFDFCASSIRDMRDRMALELLASRLSMYSDS